MAGQQTGSGGAISPPCRDIWGVATSRQGLLSVTRAHLLLPLLLKPDFPAARTEPERLSHLPLAAAELQRTYHMQARAEGGRSGSSSSSRCVREAPAGPTTPRNSPESQHSVPGSVQAVAGVHWRAGRQVKLGQCAQRRGLSQAVANLGLLFCAGFRIALSLSGHLRIAEHPGPFNLVLRFRLIVWVPGLREQCNKLPNAGVGNLRGSHDSCWRCSQAGAWRQGLQPSIHHGEVKQQRVHTQATCRTMLRATCSPSGSSAPWAPAS